MTEFVRGTLAKIAPPLAFILTALYAIKLLGYYVGADKFVNDFGVYWMAANQSAEQVYAGRGQYPFAYLPTMLLWIAPLGLLPKLTAYAIFIGASIWAFVQACRPYLSKWAILLCLLSPIFLRGVFTGQASMALAAMLLCACSIKNRWVAGVLFGIIASIKPQIVIMAPLMMALDKDWRAIVSASLTFAGAVALSVALFGFDRWPEWLASLDHFHSAYADTGLIRIATTPTAIAEHYGLAPLPFLIGGAVIGVATVFVCRDMGTLEKAAAIVIGSLMAAPYAMAYDLCAALPFLALAIMRGHMLALLSVIGGPIPFQVAAIELLRGKLIEPRKQAHA